MKIGVYYYPEQWPRHQWERDLDRIAEMGMQIIHLAEFAWFELEPSPTDIRLDWLSECVDLARQRNLQTILCTPTAAPPIWLSDRYPDSLPVDQHGQRGRFGGRRHYTPTSQDLHECAWRIVSALGERFGHDKSVIGWQIDNEYSGAFDQSKQTHIAFRKWLRTKYGDIAELNRAWGNQFWNTYYEDFDQILMPPTRNPGYANPHHCLDASRFWSWAFADFNKTQVDALKLKIDTTRQFITTNFMPFHLDCDPADMADDLTLDSWDSYPVAGWEKAIPDEHFRMADPSGIMFVHDQMASYHGRWALMELQPGQVNWSGFPVHLYPGVIRLWIWTAYAHGAEFVTTYRFRQPRWGIEMFHHALVGHDGVTLTDGGKEFAQVAREIQQVNFASEPPIADDWKPDETIGLVFEHDQLWWYDTLPQAKRWSQTAWLKMWYSAIMRLGLKMKILRPRNPWPSDLRMIVVPGLQMTDDQVHQQLNNYVAAGGHLLLTCRTALMDRNGQMWEAPTANPILPLIGAGIEGYDGLPDGTFAKLEMDGRSFDWGVWADHLTANPETQVLATYSEQFFKGTPAVTQKRHEKGTVTYCGVFAEQPFINALLEKLVAADGALKTTILPDRVQLLRRGKYWMLLNYRDQPVSAPAPANATFVMGSREVVPAGLAIWITPTA
jgi:beta-galactosidase